MTILASALAITELRAQDHIFAEPTIGVLREAIAAKRVALQNSTLRSEILRNKLAALLVPPVNGTPASVQKCYKGSTRFVAENVVAADTEALRAFAEDRLPQLLINIFDPENRGRTGELLEELKSELEKIAPEARGNAEVFVGSLLSELRYENPIRERLVGVYREARAEEVKNLIDQGYESVVIGGRPPVFAIDRPAPTELEPGAKFWQQLIRLQPSGDLPQGAEIEGLDAIWDGRTLMVNPPTLEHAHKDEDFPFFLNGQGIRYDQLRAMLPPGTASGDEGATP